jgi:hypothetical protein
LTQKLDANCRLENTEVYNIICDSLNLEPRPNNGTLRLPLRPVGLHDAEVLSDTLDLPATATSDEIMAPEADSIISISPIEASSAADPNIVPPQMVGVDAPEETPAEDAINDTPNVGNEDEKEVQEVEEEEEEEEQGKEEEEEEQGKEEEQEKNFWDFLLNELDEFRNWAGDLIQPGEKQTK